jgi:hypothetical protein
MERGDPGKHKPGKLMSWPRYKLSTSSLECYQHTHLFGVVLTVSSENQQKIMSFQREMFDADRKTACLDSEHSLLGCNIMHFGADTYVSEDPAASTISHPGSSKT